MAPGSGVGRWVVRASWRVWVWVWQASELNWRAGSVAATWIYGSICNRVHKADVYNT